MTCSRRLLGLLRGLLAAGLLAVALPAGPPAMAQTIYPIDRAELLVGAKFDFKVEFEGNVAAAEINVTINGRDAATTFGKRALVEQNEDGLGHTAYWLREVSLSAAGAYEVAAATGNGAHSVRWQAFAAPERRARNVILFIRD